MNTTPERYWIMSNDKLHEALQDCVGWLEGFVRTESDPGAEIPGVLYLALAAHTKQEG